MWIPATRPRRGLALADRIAVMHDGRLEQVGTQREILARPASEFVRDLFAKSRGQLRLLTEGLGAGSADGEVT